MKRSVEDYGCVLDPGRVVERTGDDSEDDGVKSRFERRFEEQVEAALAADGEREEGVDDGGPRKRRRGMRRRVGERTDMEDGSEEGSEGSSGEEQSQSQEEDAEEDLEGEESWTDDGDECSWCDGKGVCVHPVVLGSARDIGLTVQVRSGDHIVAMMNVTVPRVDVRGKGVTVGVYV